MLKSKVLFDSFIIIEKVGINVEFSETVKKLFDSFVKAIKF